MSDERKGRAVKEEIGENTRAAVTRFLEADGDWASETFSSEKAKELRKTARKEALKAIIALARYLEKSL
jgi:hypothetical protein